MTTHPAETMGLFEWTFVEPFRLAWPFIRRRIDRARYWVLSMALFLQLTWYSLFGA